MRSVFKVVFIGLCIAAALGCERKPKVKYVDLSKQPFKDCEKGVDFNSRDCDREVEDHTFWVGQIELKEAQKLRPEGRSNGMNFKGPINDFVTVIYEFIPPASKGDRAGFRRAYYFKSEDGGQSYGYMESGQLDKISHDEVVLNVTWNSCDGTGVMQENGESSSFRSFSTWPSVPYVRKGETLSLNKKKMSLLEALIVLPLIKPLEWLVKGLANALGGEVAEWVFDQPIELNSYDFEMSFLPVKWGCEKKGQFVKAPDIDIRLFL